MGLEDLEQLPQGLIDEEQRHQTSKGVLGELCEVSDQSGSLEACNYQGDDKGPDANPDSPVKELLGKSVSAKIEQSFIIEKDRSSGADDDERTARKEGKDDPTDTCHDECLSYTNIILCLSPHDTTEGNCSRESSKVDEDCS